MARVFGEVEGQTPGAEFENRRALSDAGVHKPNQAGISGSAKEGADSIVVNGGYEDDEDYGAFIIYTGAGGRDPNRGHQIADQEFTGANAALARSCTEGLPVRVIRGTGTVPHLAPKSGYRYDGLYRVAEFWMEEGKAGFKVCRFKLVKDDALPFDNEGKYIATPTARRTTSIQRIVRNSEVSQRVKVLHSHTCQICRSAIDTPAGPYAEGAHVRPLGRPHDGPDVEENILCLCPNDHVRFDCLAIAISNDLQILDTVAGKQIGRLSEVTGHSVEQAHIAYHRKLCGL